MVCLFSLFPYQFSFPSVLFGGFIVPHLTRTMGMQVQIGDKKPVHHTWYIAPSGITQHCVSLNQPSLCFLQHVSSGMAQKGRNLPPDPIFRLSSYRDSLLLSSPTLASHPDLRLPHLRVSARRITTVFAATHPRWRGRQSFPVSRGIPHRTCAWTSTNGNT